MTGPRAPIPLVIDTDTASDDAVALLIAAVSGLAEVLAVTTVAGNVPLAQGTRNALYTLELAGSAHVPVYLGCDRPMLRSYVSARHVHGSDGMSDTGLPAPARAPEDEHGVDALLRLARAHPPRSLTLVTLGPLTNIAAAVVRERSLLSRFRHVYCMAGAADGVGNISATAEYNVWADPEAAAIVLAAADPDQVTWIGWDVSRRDAVMTARDQSRLRSLGTPLALFADSINRAVGDWAAKVTGLPGYDLPDPIAMSVALDPRMILESERVHVTVGTGTEARGQLIADRRRTAAAANLTLVRRADADRFKALLFEVCGTAPAAGQRPRQAPSS